MRSMASHTPSLAEPSDPLLSVSRPLRYLCTNVGQQRLIRYPFLYRPAYARLKSCSVSHRLTLLILLSVLRAISRASCNSRSKSGAGRNSPFSNRSRMSRSSSVKSSLTMVASFLCPFMQQESILPLQYHGENRGAVFLITSYIICVVEHPYPLPRYSSAASVITFNPTSSARSSKPNVPL